MMWTEFGTFIAEGRDKAIEYLNSYIDRHPNVSSIQFVCNTRDKNNGLWSFIFFITYKEK